MYEQQFERGLASSEEIESSEAQIQNQNPQEIEETTELPVKEEVSEREPFDPYAAINEAAHNSATISEFKYQIDTMAINAINSGQPNEILNKASSNLARICRGYENFRIARDLPAAGMTNLETTGVEISADHLANVWDDESALDIQKTLRHEAEHQTQKALPDNFKVTDPKTGEVIGSEVLHEGGAEYATASELGQGKQAAFIESSADPDLAKYKKGFKLYQSYEPSQLNQHIKKDSGKVGDKISLQAELAKEASIKDQEGLEKLAQKANFSVQETDDLIDRAA